MKTCIDTILEKFDFEKVHAYMFLSKWTYRGEKETPSIKELKSLAYNLLRECYTEITKDPNKEHFCSTGGFKASYNVYDKRLRLDFILESDTAFFHAE